MAEGQCPFVSEYRKDIHGLRAIAVICVIIDHLSHAALPGGYLGVDVFFVISGYVITTSLEKTRYPSVGSQLLHFYSRRIKRLMPALLTVLLLAGAAIRLFDADPEISALTGITAIFGSSNFFLLWQATNYFGAAAQRNMFAHTWSLGVEEQFYLFYPFLFRWRRPLQSQSFWDERFRLGALAALSAVSLLAFIIVYRVNQPAAYFLMPCRFWELGLGCMMAIVVKLVENGERYRRIRIPAWIPFFALVPGFVLGTRYPVASTILVVVATTALIGTNRQDTALYKLLASRPFTYLGAISYSLYLWHWPVICVSVWTIGIHAWSVPFQLALMLLLAMASYHGIENRLRRAHWTENRWGVIAIGLPCMFAAAVLMFVGQRYHFPHYTGNYDLEAGADAPAPGYVSRYSHRKVDQCFAKNVYGANHALAETKVQECSAIGPAALRLIFVGDSHSMDLFPMADKIYNDGVASVTNVFQTGCKVPPLKSDPAICGYVDALVKDSAPKPTQNTALVIRVNYAPRAISGDLKEFSSSLNALLARTSAAGMKVIYILPAPKYYSLNNLCVPQWFRPKWAMGPECRNGFTEDRNEQLTRRRDVTDYLLELSKRRPDFFVFDPFDLFCGSAADACTPLRNGQLIYRDGSHLTEGGSELLVAPFEQFLRDHQLVSRTPPGIQ